MSQAVLMSGGHGFIGRRLSPVLTKLGWDVRMVDRRGQPREAGSTVGDRSPAASAFVHLAFPASPAARRSPAGHLLAEVRAQTSQCLSTAQGGGLIHFVLASSGKVYGRAGRLPITEDHPVNPTTLLGKLKREQEHLVALEALRSRRMGSTLLRIFNVYGPAQSDEFLIGHLARGLRRGAAIPLGELSHGRDWLYVDDVAAAFALALANPPAPGEVRVMNVASGIATTAKEIVSRLEAITGLRIRVIPDPRRARPDEPQCEYADARPLRELCWQPKVSLNEGLARVWQAVRE